MSLSQGKHCNLLAQSSCNYCINHLRISPRKRCTKINPQRNTNYGLTRVWHCLNCRSLKISLHWRCRALQLFVALRIVWQCISFKAPRHYISSALCANRVIHIWRKQFIRPFNSANLTSYQDICWMK